MEKLGSRYAEINNYYTDYSKAQISVFNTQNANYKFVFTWTQQHHFLVQPTAGLHCHLLVKHIMQYPQPHTKKTHIVPLVYGKNFNCLCLAQEIKASVSKQIVAIGPVCEFVVFSRFFMGMCRPCLIICCEQSSEEILARALSTSSPTSIRWLAGTPGK